MGSRRLYWTELPREVQKWVEVELGSPVISAESQSGGFSLGTADRLVTGSGSRAFLKAVSATEHKQTAHLHRQEGRVSATLPAGMPVAGFIGFKEFDLGPSGSWVALLLEDIEGKHPLRPWQSDQLRAVFRALDKIAQIEVDPALGLETVEESLQEELVFWDVLAEGLTEQDLEPAASASNHRKLLELLPYANQQGKRYAELVRYNLVPHLGGSNLVHTDIRADNILVTADGAVIVDWPWANVGNSSVDVAAVVADAVAADPLLHLEELLKLMPTETRPSADFLFAYVVAVAGYYLFASTRPSSPSTHESLIEERASRAANLLSWIRTQYQ